MAHRKTELFSKDEEYEMHILLLFFSEISFVLS